MQKVLMALLDKRRALKTEADAINTAIDKADYPPTAEQAARLKALQADGDKVAGDIEAFAATLPEDFEKTKTDAVAAAVTAAITATREVDSNIAATCHIGGQAAKASAFIKDGKSLADVQAAVTAGKAENSGRELRTHGDGGAPEGHAWDKTIDRVNARFGKK